MKLKIGSWSLTPYLLVIALVGLQACGGGSDPAPASTPDVNANPTGYYTGSAAVKADDDATDLSIDDIQILINAGRIMIMSDSQVVVYDGQMSITANDFTSTVDIYENNIKAGTALVSGTITEGSQITGTFTGIGLGNGTFTSTYSNLNNTTSAAETIDTVTKSALWDCRVDNSNNILSMDIDSSGVVITTSEPTSSTFANCQIEGSVTPIAGEGLYSIDLSTVTNSCATSAVNSENTGVYTGFAITEMSTNPNDRLVFTMSNGTYSVGTNCSFAD